MTATPWGFRDILPEEAQAREEIALTVKGCFREHHYLPVETPLLEDKGSLEEGGRIADIGTHEELLSRNAMYQDIYYSQNKASEEANAVDPVRVVATPEEMAAELAQRDDVKPEAPAEEAKGGEQR